MIFRFVNLELSIKSESIPNMRFWMIFWSLLLTALIFVVLIFMTSEIIQVSFSLLCATSYALPFVGYFLFIFPSRRYSSSPDEILDQQP